MVQCCTAVGTVGEGFGVYCRTVACSVGVCWGWGTLGRTVGVLPAVLVQV